MWHRFNLGHFKKYIVIDQTQQNFLLLRWPRMSQILHINRDNSFFFILIFIYLTLIAWIKWLNLCHMITHLFLRTATGTHPWHLFNPSIKINNQFQLYLWYIYINILYQQYQLNIIILLQCTVFLLNNAPLPYSGL
jgi:hypothetical protein